jgi:diaminohydroxyphosphoribosylaminopyrimidine deaminase/5-amino-6-(5-phosphoribosylamino)uracil reductase
MTDPTASDRAHMTRALLLAERGLYTTTPNPRVGCVVVKNGAVIGEGWHERAGFAHAEVSALADAAARGEDPRGATLYVTLEPCNHVGRTTACTDAVLAAGISRVVYAMNDPNPSAANGARRLAAAGVRVDAGLCEHEARELNPGFISVMTRGRPWVRLKVAASLDGRTALANGESRWITGEAARNDGHHFRARACAVLTGIGTVRSDDPELTVRAVPTPRQPRRIVLDRNAEMPPTARVLQGAGALVVTAGARHPGWPAGIESIALPDATGRVDLPAMLHELARRDVNELHVEAGAGLNGALLAADLVDELLLYVAPSILGDPARGIADFPGGLAALSARVPFALHDVLKIGDDLRIIARTVKGTS